MTEKKHLIFDTEIIGSTKPVFLLCAKCVETQQCWAFWHHRRGHLKNFRDLLEDPGYTWVSFNGIKFDAPLVSAWINGHDVHVIKSIATLIIKQKMMPWDAHRMAGGEVKFDHIDLIEPAPGVFVSLKTYAGRMHYPSMVDLPFHYDTDLTPTQCRVLENYCLNDLGVTEQLFKRLQTELRLRIDLGATYDLDLRSKSDAQAAEAILKKVAKLGKASGVRPRSVTYTAPGIIKTRSPTINALIDRCENELFGLDVIGSPIEAHWMKDPIELHGGLYKFGLGGLHSQHDKNFYSEADSEYEISDIDAGSYYPSIMLKCNLVPQIGGRGEAFLNAYGDIYAQRMQAKRSGQKAIAQALKISLNGTFGKLGNIYCPFYAPELLLAVTLTGQLNLLCLIDELARNKGIDVVSANTDGIMVRYKRNLRDKVFKIIAANSKRTGFEYEETRYQKVAMKDVNNYLALKLDGEIKAKGLYADEGLQKNPTAFVCSLAAAQFLKTGTKPEQFIKKHTRFEDFLSIRNVSGGGIQHQKYVEVDDWIEVEPRTWRRPGWDALRAPVRRVSRPAPVLEGRGGKPFGRVARWYMTTDTLPPITAVGSGNKIPKTDGAKLCMTLPDAMPKDLNHQWYIDETYSILNDLGVVHETTT